MKKHFEISSFDPLAGYVSADDTLAMKMDLSSAVHQGIRLPSERAVPGKRYFRFSFSVKNNDTNTSALYYKIFYQNESSKFREIDREGFVGEYNPLASENFYGSWENTGFTFKKISLPEDILSPLTVVDSFRIVGNPRNERKYYGNRLHDARITDELIHSVMEKIEANEDWYADIVKKAGKNKIPISEQVYLDAVWMIDYDRHKMGEVNHRWKRNPRTGIYSFIIVVADEVGLAAIPEYIKDISRKNEHEEFVNPYYYFLHGEGSRNQHIQTFRAERYLRTWAQLDLGGGIYMDRAEYRVRELDTSCYHSTCNPSDSLYRNAHFKQFFHNINMNYVLYNIPVVDNVRDGSYNREKFEENRLRYKDADIPGEYFRNSDCPCETVFSDPVKDRIVLTVPGNKNREVPVKENVGVKSRIGFTYGKFRARIRFPEMMNEDNVWNGLTNAFWMIYQDEYAWNSRRECSSGYIPAHLKGRTDERVATESYSEIDFEIVKTSPFWPDHTDQDSLTISEAAGSGDVIIACTNWDLACRDPKNFSTGRHKSKCSGVTAQVHRWDDWYKAITAKYAIDEDAMFKRDYYYFEIDWKPERIVWRIGPEEDQMFPIVCMDNEVTSIPNNQMVIVVTQEFHHADWWPMTPFPQHFIPYPKDDIVGEILEVVIE